VRRPDYHWRECCLYTMLETELVFNVPFIGRAETLRPTNKAEELPCRHENFLPDTARTGSAKGSFKPYIKHSSIEGIRLVRHKALLDYACGSVFGRP
jgi:hypothetical protein